jgi:two-component system, LytTR family, sensor kinase
MAPLRHNATRVLGLFALGMVPGLITFSNLFGSGEVTPTWHHLAFYALPWIAWAYYTPLIRLSLRRWAPLEDAGRPAWFGVHVLTFAPGWVGNEVVETLLRRWNPWPKYQVMDFVPYLLMELRHSFITDIVVYFGACGVIYALETRSRLRAQEMNAARLEAQLARSQLEALRVQLHPHFLFNTLNAISMMARKGETDVAVRMLAGLSDLLRLALASVGKPEVPLRLELDFLERYLALQQIRFSDRLEVKMHISPEAMEARVPSLVLQPLAENAVRHGLSPRDEGGLLEIGAQRDGADLVLSVRDTGVGLAPESERRGGVGLQNVRARLAVLYPNAHRFTLENHPGGGTLALVCIPFHREALVDV